MTRHSASDLDRALWALRAYDTTALATVSAAGPHVAGVFCAPEQDGERLRLVMAVLHGSRKLEDLAADPRVAFMCSPGNPSRWVQGSGRARVVEDPSEAAAAIAALVAHAPGVRRFVDGLHVDTVIVDITRLKIVEDISRPPLVLTFGSGAEAA